MLLILEHYAEINRGRRTDRQLAKEVTRYALTLVVGDLGGSDMRDILKYRTATPKEHSEIQRVRRHAVPTSSIRVTAIHRPSRRRLDDLIDAKFYTHEDEL
jgi:hypothetical protein